MHPTLHTRDGQQFTGQIFKNASGHLVARQRRKCTRCGGAGRSEKWRATGYTCYDCGGSGTHPRNPVLEIKLYTQDKLDKLNATQAKATATRETKRQAAAKQKQAEADSRRDAFNEAHAELIAKATKYAPRSDFIADVLRTATAKAAFTEKQAAALKTAIARFEAEDHRLENQSFRGKVGERLRGLEVTVTQSLMFGEKYSGFGPSWLTVMRAGNDTFTVKSGAFRPRIGAVLVIDATVKTHETYKGTKKTVLTRVKTIESKTPQDVRDAWGQAA